MSLLRRNFYASKVMCKHCQMESARLICVREYPMKQQRVLGYVLLSLWVAEHELSQEQYV